jgi:N-methylhydantoinase A
LRVAIDTGGTFTDCVYLFDGRLHVLKLLSTSADPSLAVLDALKKIQQAHPQKDLAAEGYEVRHGTTVGTNAMLERKGARVAFVTTAGFEDTIAIGRQTRAKLYDWFAPVPVCIVPGELRFGVHERVTAEAEILRSPTEEELQTLAEAVRKSGAESIALSFLFSFARPESEQRTAQALSRLNLPISISHRILPEFREYERASTVVINAYLAPKMQHYLRNLEEQVTTQFHSSRVDVMQSSGGIVPAKLAADEPVRTLLSGPAGGVVGASAVARWAGFERIIGIDMGGTSTDVFLSDAALGGAQLTRETILSGMPVSVPMLDIHTVGAGGGSIARFDAGGLLRVGPESAGADPGPACFGRGAMPTVTDANLILGRLDPQGFLNGGVSLDRDRAAKILFDRKASLASAEEFASGIVRVVETQMEKAIRVISMERGFDPREFTLVAFGGGGPLHACALARSLRIPTVLIPIMPGALSAVGILLADAVRDYSRTVMCSTHQTSIIDEAFAELQHSAISDFAASGLAGTSQRSIDVRYRKQAYELNVPYGEDNFTSSTLTASALTASLDAFHRQHQQRYGFSDPARAVEIVNVRLRMSAAGEPYSPPVINRDSRDQLPAKFAEREIYIDGKLQPARIYQRESLSAGDTIAGPAMISEYTSSTLLLPGCVAQVDGYGNLVITVGEENAS